MSLIDASLSRSRTIISLLVFILIAGTISYINIPKESDPDINIPIIYTTVNHEGISPEDAERLLVRPIEKEVQSIEGIKEMRSTAFEGGANILLEFEAGFDADKALVDVREKVDLAKPELPDDSDEPTVHEVNLSLFPVLVVSISGQLPERALLKLARNLKDEIETIPSVLSADLKGDREEVVEVIIDPMLATSYDLRPDDILAVTRRSNQLIAAGAMDTGKGRFSIKVPGLFEDIRDILDMPLKTQGDAVVRIGDVASVQKTFKDPTTFARLNGEKAIALEVTKRSGENIIDTIEAVKTSVLGLKDSWPKGAKVSFSQDKSGDIRSMLTDLQNNVTSAILLVMIVIVAALGLRGGLLVGIAIPGSFLAGILVLAIAGMTVNVVVLFALILSVGMLVDGAIVVIEYADRKLAEGEPRHIAYGLAAKRMAWPIIASTATTLAAFLPLLFWPGLVGEFMKFLPITLIATLTASLAMALIFIPVLGTNLTTVITIVMTAAVTGGMGILGSGIVENFIGKDLAIFGGIIFALVGLYLGYKIGRHSGYLLDKQSDDPDQVKQLSAEHDQESLHKLGGFTGGYLKILHVALKHPTKILILAVGCLIGSNILYAQFGKGLEFFPAIEPSLGILNIHARGNLSVDEKDSLVREVEEIVFAIQSKEKEFKTIYTTSGNLTARDEDAEDIIGKIQMEFTEWNTRRKAVEIQAELTERTAHLYGIWVEYREEEQGPPTGKPINIQLSSRNAELLEPLIIQIRQHMDTVKGLRDIEDSRPIPGIVWELNVDRAQASKFGADVRTIGYFIQLITKGMKLTDYRPDDTDEEVDIVARFPEEYRTIGELDRVRINTEAGSAPLSSFVTRTAENQTGTLRRTDAKRIAYILSEIDVGVLADDKVHELRDWIATINIPEGVSVTFKGEDQEQAKSMAFLVKAFAVALFLMAVILVTQFNSFYSAFLILFAVVMSTAGVLIGLMIVGEPFGVVMSGVGVIALAGIVVNNNIVLIDTFDRLVKTEDSPLNAILLTGAQRLRPVLLTTVTTVLGLLPMVLQMNIDFVGRDVSIGAPSTQWWKQLATAIAFGLTFATILTLLVTPSALMIRENLKARKIRKANEKNQHIPASESDLVESQV